MPLLRVGLTLAAGSVLALILLLVACTAKRSQDGLNPATGTDSNTAFPTTSTQPGPTPGAAPILPAPAQLAGKRRKQARFVEADLTKDASQFDPALPSNLVTANGAVTDFAPNFTGRLGGCAYCIYDFNISGYDRNAQLRALWATAADDGNIFFGLANWDRDRWDWFKGSAQPKLNLPTITPYISFSGELLLVVLCCGDAQTLSSVRIGGQPPSAVFTLSAVAGMVPVLNSVDATASSDPDGSIVKYEWDFDGDGSFETDAGNTAAIGHDFAEPGFINVALRVTDDDGLSATFSQPLTACGEWIHSLGGGQDSRIAAVQYDGKGNIYATGVYVDENTDTQVLLCRFDLTGALIWSRTWGATNDDTGHDLAFDSDGNVVVCSLVNTDAGTGKRQNLLVQVWSPAGNLVTSLYLGTVDQFNPARMQVLGHRAYLFGTAKSFENLGLLALDLDTGNIPQADAWTIDGDSNISVFGVALRSTFIIGGGNALDAVAVGEVSLPGGTRAFAASFDNNTDESRLDLSGAKILSVNSSSAGAVTFRGNFLPDTIVGGTFLDGSSKDVFVSNLNGSQEPQAFWNAGNSATCTGMATRPNGSLALCGSRSFDQALWLDLDTSLGTSADVYNDTPDVSFQSNLRAISGVCGVAGGSCGSAQTLSVAPLENNSGPAVLIWGDQNLTPVSVTMNLIIGLPGTVDSSPVIDLDSSVPGVRSALLVSRAL